MEHYGEHGVELLLESHELYEELWRDLQGVDLLLELDFSLFLSCGCVEVWHSTSEEAECVIRASGNVSNTEAQLN